MSDLGTQIEVIYVVNGTTKVDVFRCRESNVTMAGGQSPQATYVELTDGRDEKGRPVPWILYRNAERVIKREARAADSHVAPTNSQEWEQAAAEGERRIAASAPLIGALVDGTFLPGPLAMRAETPAVDGLPAEREGGA